MKKNKIYGLIGKNISYSFSREYFSNKFKTEKISSKYLNFDLIDINQIYKLTKEFNLSGLNVTIPYKESIIQFLDETDSKAKQIGAVNTIKFFNNKMIGYNTDYIGFKKSLQNISNINIPKNALILGTGGASKAVKFALSELGIGFKTVSRVKNNADYTYQEIDKYIIDKKLIINCSPVGTFPNIKDSPKIPYQYLTSENFLYDLVYNPDKTLFLKKGDEIGCFTKNGVEMLKIQAEKAWEIWNDISN
jgi:shikimate dehydrogenase|tara:strand:- start:2621 stop:3364 length:744 start_codon:yes stop_codon:yes gene_type:complete